MAPWCRYISCLEIAARYGSGRDSVRGSVGAMNAKLSRPDGFATVQSGRKQAQSRVCTPGFTETGLETMKCMRVHLVRRQPHVFCIIYFDAMNGIIDLLANYYIFEI